MYLLFSLFLTFKSVKFNWLFVYDISLEPPVGIPLLSFENWDAIELKFAVFGIGLSTELNNFLLLLWWLNFYSKFYSLSKKLDWLFSNSNWLIELFYESVFYKLSYSSCSSIFINVFFFVLSTELIEFEFYSEFILRLSKLFKPKCAVSRFLLSFEDYRWA
jgi:hypothetical protein